MFEVAGAVISEEPSQGPSPIFGDRICAEAPSSTAIALTSKRISAMCSAQGLASSGLGFFGSARGRRGTQGIFPV
ncbi:hypothetical protein U1Q18_023405 [Sarracenia purpurea var. burkii]